MENQPVRVMMDDISVMVCNKGFYEACDICEYKFLCFTNTKKQITVLEYWKYWQQKQAKKSNKKSL